MLIKEFLVTLPILLGLDIIWLALIAKNLYRQQIGFLMKDNLSLAPAALFYPLFAVGLILFVISPALAHRSWNEALLRGALLGLIAYAAYDLTNLSTLKNWPVPMSLIDMAWGTVLAGTTSALAYLILNRI